MIKRIILVTSVLSLLFLLACTNQETKKLAEVESDNAKLITGNVSVNLTSSTTEVKKGDIVKASISLNTRESAVNSAQLVFDYDQNLLEYDDVSTSASKFTIWVEKKATNGKLSLVAAEPNPGISGQQEYIAVAIFKAKDSGLAKIQLDPIDSKVFSTESMNILRSEGHTPLEITIE